MTNSSLVLVDLMIVAAWVALVTEEMNLIVILLNILEAERLIPSLWEYIKRYLTSNGKLQIQTLELLLESRNEGGPNVSGLIVILEGVSLIS